MLCHRFNFRINATLPVSVFKLEFNDTGVLAMILSKVRFFTMPYLCFLCLEY